MSSSKAQPNIVFIMTDQQRADFSRRDGYALDPTPFLDAFADRGTRFRNAYTPMPVCAPARCSVFSGRYPSATRVRDNGGIDQIVKDGDLIQVLKQQGYSVNLAGKNHSFLDAADFDFWAEYNHRDGPPDRTSPEEMAFETWLKEIQFKPYQQPTPFPMEYQMAYRAVDDAIECVDAQGERPFFLWLSLPEPHNPYQVPEPYFSLFPEDAIPDRVAGPEVAEQRGGHWRWMSRIYGEKQPGHDERWRRYRANYLGMMRLVDDQVRRFIDHLEATDRYENTIFVFFSDHGDFAADYGLQRKGVGLPECLVRVPLFFVGPGVSAAHYLEESCASLVDIMPTICELIGAEVPRGVQGVSLAPLLRNEVADGEAFLSAYSELGIGGLPWGAEDRPPLPFPYEGERINELNDVTQSGSQRMVRKGLWKLLVDQEESFALYNLERDPGELDNLVDDPEHAPVRQALTDELVRWLVRTQDILPVGELNPRLSR